jgi:hypothetical protein
VVSWDTARRVYAVVVVGLVAQLAFVLLNGGGGHGLPVGRVTGSAAASAAISLLAWLLPAVAVYRWRGHPRHRRAADGALVAGAALIVYLANGATLPSGDTVPARYLPLSLWREADLDLDEFPFLYRPERPYWLASVNGRMVSEYPVAPAILAAPVYALSALGGVRADSRFVLEVEKLAAAAITAASVFVVVLLVRQFSSAAMSVAIAVVYAIGTSSLSTSSQALWQHGPVQLAIAAALYGLARARGEPRWLLGAGFAMGAAVVCRPPTVLIVTPLAAWAVLRLGARGAVLCAAGAAPAVAFQLWYNAVYFGQLSRTQFPMLEPALWSTPLWHGLAGVLVSPGRGLLVYSPVLALALVGGALAWRCGGDGLLRAASVGAVASVVLNSKWLMWWGGHSYGPRLLADILPALALLLAPAERLLAERRLLRVVFASAAAWSIFAHGAGVFGDGHRWSAYPDVNRFPERLWAWRDSPPHAAVRGLVDRAMIAVRGLPTSRSRPDLLSGRVALSAGAGVRAADQGDHRLAAVPVQVVNEGGAVWLSRGPGDVALAWRWAAAGAAAGGGAVAGVHHLVQNVFPGGEYRSTLLVDLSTAPPGSRLEVGLLAFLRDGPRWIGRRLSVQPESATAAGGS